MVLDEPTPMSIPGPPPGPPAPPIAAPVAPANYGASEDPSYRQNRPPKYPGKAARAGDEGEVVLRVLVGPDGAPLKVEIEKSSRSRDLDRAAIEAVKTWRFNPAMKNGQAVQDWVLVPINFTL